MNEEIVCVRTIRAYLNWEPYPAAPRVQGEMATEAILIYNLFALITSLSLRCSFDNEELLSKRVRLEGSGAAAHSFHPHFHIFCGTSMKMHMYGTCKYICVVWTLLCNQLQRNSINSARISLKLFILLGQPQICSKYITCVCVSLWHKAGYFATGRLCGNVQ